MTYEQFELTVIQLARQGVRLTVANVCAALNVEFSKAEGFLDRMAQQGRLDVEIDEDEGLVFYRVRGLSPMPRALDLRAPIQPPPQPSGRRKSAVTAAIFGLLVPGAGLLYAAPWSVALVGALTSLVLVQMLGALPLVGGLLSSVALGLCALASALLGVLYTKQYNRHGKRVHLEASDVQAGPRAVMGAGWTG